jgi:uncharacterized protein YecT (DUF1311 family)
VQSCLKSSVAAKRDQTSCIDVIANPCIGDETAASPGLIIECFAREESVWDRMLNDAFKTLREGLGNDLQIKLRDMQRSWLESRRRTCAFYADYFKVR